MTDRIIRPATMADLDTIEHIVAEAYSPYIERMGREPAPMLEDYAGHIEAGRVHVLELNGRVAGMVVLMPQGEAMLLDNIAVHPDAQSHGLGRMLLDFAEREAAAQGFSAIRLYTNEEMTENIAMYPHLGYVESHRVFEKGYRRVYFEKKVG